MMKIAPDKWKHFYVGLAMGLVFQAVLDRMMPDRLILASVIALIVITAISYGFELFSKFTGLGHYEVMDAVAAVIGGLLGMGVVLGIHFIR